MISAPLQQMPNCQVAVLCVGALHPVGQDPGEYGFLYSSFV